MENLRPETVSIIDLLSSDPDFKLLLLELQRARLIADINVSHNITLVAVKNDVLEHFIAGKSDQDLWRYHIINTTDTIGNFVADTWLQIDKKKALGIHIYESKGELKIGSSNVIKRDWKADNGVIHVVDKMLHIPPSPYRVIEGSPELRHLFTILSHFDIIGSTLFAPNDKAFSVLSDVEVAYLCSSHGSADLQRIMDRHVLEDIIYRQDITDKLSLRTVEGENITLEVKEQSFTADGADVVKSDILTNQGVLHIVNRLSIPHSYEFTPLKALYGLGSDTFAQLIIQNGLVQLVNSENQTIFAPVNSSVSHLFTFRGDAHHSPLSYNLIPEAINLDLLEDGHLLETEFRPCSLNGKPQRVKIRKQGKRTFVNSVEFTGTSGFINRYNSKIYQLSSILSTPLPFPFAATPELSLSKSLELINRAGLENELYSKAKSQTLILPTNLAWETLGLVHKFIQSNDTLLKDLILNTVIQGGKPLYSQDIQKEPQVVETRFGEKFTLWTENEEIKLQHLSKHCTFIDRDILAENGVAHSITCIPVPSSISISPRDLLVSGKASMFMDLLTKFGLDNVLQINGNYSILAPTDSVLDYENIHENSTDIGDIVRLHILKPSSGGNVDCETNPFGCLTCGESLSGHHVVTRKINSDVSLVHIDGDRYERSARVLDRGLTSLSGQVIILDRVLRPDWLVSREPQTGKMIGIGFAIAMGVFLGILAIVFSVFKIISWRRNRSPESRRLLAEDDHSEIED